MEKSKNRFHGALAILLGALHMVEKFNGVIYGIMPMPDFTPQGIEPDLESVPEFRGEVPAEPGGTGYNAAGQDHVMVVESAIRMIAPLDNDEATRALRATVVADRITSSEVSWWLGQNSAYTFATVLFDVCDATLQAIEAALEFDVSEREVFWRALETQVRDLFSELDPLRQEID